MLLTVRSVLEIICALGALAAMGYYALCLWSTRTFLGEADQRKPGRFTPPVSVLKPLKGADPEMYENLRSHCLQQYPEYEIVFGVNDEADEALGPVRRLQQEFPQLPISVVICCEILGTNRKVSNLIQMQRAARHQHLVINDSDIRVTPDYLKRVMVPLAEPHVGMVTCLYRGVAGPTLGSRLEALGISTDFCPGVLAASAVERGIHFALGSTLAFRRRDLESIGGFAPIVDYLADDYELGRRMAAQGLEVCLSEVVVETFLPAYSFREYFAHQLRWARGVRDARFSGYVGLVFTFGTVWALLALIFSQGALWSWGLLTLVLACRVAMALAVGKAVLHDRQLPRSLWLVPVRDLIAVCVWLVSFWGNTVTWRGDRFRLQKGRLLRINSPAPRGPAE
jgi:ceramide glucosyltransferase